MKILRLLSLVIFTQIVSTLTCDIDLWPVYVGSDNHRYSTNCIDYDRVSNSIVIGGTQRSVFSEETAGFVYGLDQNANWLWGGTISRGSSQLTEVVKCQMNSDSSLFTVFGLSGNKPVLVEIDTVSSEVKKYIELTVAQQEG